VKARTVVGAGVGTETVYATTNKEGNKYIGD